jgi:WD40 repeat protein
MICLWNLASGRTSENGVLKGNTGDIVALAFSPDGQTLFSGGKDGEVKLWPTRRPAREDTFANVRQPLGFSRNGQTLAGLTRENTVVFLNLATGEPEQLFHLERGRFRFPPSPVLVSEDLRILAHGRDDGTVRLWNSQTGETNTLKVSEGPVELLALSPDGQQFIFIARGREWSLRRWDVPSGTNTLWRADIFRAIYSPDGRTLATFGRTNASGRTNAVQLWDAASLTLRASLPTEEPPDFRYPAPAFSRDSRLLAVVDQDDTIRIWDTTTGQALGACAGHKQDVSSVAFSPDGKTLVTASDDSTLKFWNVATRQELLTIRRLGGALRALHFSPDGDLLVGGTSSSSRTGGLYFYRAPQADAVDTVIVPAARASIRR